MLSHYRTHWVLTSTMDFYLLKCGMLLGTLLNSCTPVYILLNSQYILMHYVGYTMINIVHASVYTNISFHTQFLTSEQRKCLYNSMMPFIGPTHHVNELTQNLVSRCVQKKGKESQYLKMHTKLRMSIYCRDNMVIIYLVYCI